MVKYLEIKCPKCGNENKNKIHNLERDKNKNICQVCGEIW